MSSSQRSRKALATFIFSDPKGVTFSIPSVNHGDAPIIGRSKLTTKIQQPDHFRKQLGQEKDSPKPTKLWKKKDEFLVESWEMWIIQNVLSPLQGLSMIFEVLLVLSTLRRSKLATTPQPGHWRRRAAALGAPSNAPRDPYERAPPKTARSNHAKPRKKRRTLASSVSTSDGGIFFAFGKNARDGCFKLRGVDSWWLWSWKNPRLGLKRSLNFTFERINVFHHSKELTNRIARPEFSVFMDVLGNFLWLEWGEFRS